MDRHTPLHSRFRLAAWLAAVTLTFSAQAGPSLPHLGEYPQGDFRQSSTAPDAEPTSAEIAPEALGLCPVDTRAYRKSLLVMAFPRRGDASANGGGLQGAELALPQWLAGRLANSGALFHHQAINANLPLGSPAETAQQARQLARERQAQLILAGAVLDLGMARPKDLLNPDLITRGRNAAVSTFGLNEEWDTRQRHFVLHLELLDGVTGNAVFRHEYRLRGVWNPDHPGRARFGTPAFWETDYGQKVEQLLTEASSHLEEAIRCQPLVARLNRRTPGSAPLLEAGRVQGLEAGDRLPLYRVSLRQVPGEYRQYTAHRLASGATLTVVRAYAHSSEVRLEGDWALYGEHLAVTPGPGSETASHQASPPPDPQTDEASGEAGEAPDAD
ncbi:flagella assembly protein FlgT middle domain-containing protein [Marinimicrobium agarilyticum]|uniref:flagella assembly protein FlgT middle domain-containing protein n=1 Tax=Marinimicrobium agarilyticum TaxID=306546 RepID=UPI0004217BF1|nr:flagella assembly protein FlgT middle domain-containing protein [Marinimicrobium agarilyticum]